jgi:hypothetical protein
MGETSDIPRDEEALGELAELELALAKSYFADAMACEDLKEKMELGRAFQRQARGARLSLALHRKFRSEREQGASPEVEKRLWRQRDSGRIEQRKADLRTALHRVIWCETEGEKADYLCDLLEERLELHGRSPAFGANNLDDHVRDLSRSLGFPHGASNDWRNLPDPDWIDDEDEEDEAAEPELENSA